MKSIKYLGPPVTLGRFGRIEPDAVLNMYENEWACLHDSPDFELILPGNAATRQPIALRPVDAINPLEFKWDHPRLSEYLKSLGRTTVTNIAQAMVEVGSPMVVTEHGTFEDLVDAVVEEANFSGLTSLDLAERRQLTADAAVTSTAESEAQADEDVPVAEAAEESAEVIDARDEPVVLDSAPKPARTRKR